MLTCLPKHFSVHVSKYESNLLSSKITENTLILYVYSFIPPKYVWIDMSIHYVVAKATRTISTKGDVHFIS